MLVCVCARTCVWCFRHVLLSLILPLGPDGLGDSGIPPNHSLWDYFSIPMAK